MKPRNYWLMLIAGVFALSTAQASSLDFELVNNTGIDVFEVYVSPSDLDEWGEDIMEEDVLEDGASVRITFDPAEEAELWDLMVNDGQGNAVYWEGLDLNKISTFTISMETSAGDGGDQE